MQLSQITFSSALKLNDRSFKYLFIISNYDKILNEEQKSFLQLVTSNKSTSAFADKILKLVEDAAIKLLKMKKLSPEEIADAQGLSLNKVLELQEKITVHA